MGDWGECLGRRGPQSLGDKCGFRDWTVTKGGDGGMDVPHVDRNVCLEAASCGTAKGPVRALHHKVPMMRCDSWLCPPRCQSRTGVGLSLSGDCSAFVTG